MKRGLILLIIALASLIGSGYLVKCGGAVSDDVPQSIREKVYSLYPGASNIEWEKERKGNYEAEFVHNGKKVSLLLDDKANLLEAVTQVSENELPSQVSADIGKREGMRVTRALHISSSGNSYYRVVGVTHDKRFRLEYNGEGKLVKEIVIDKEKKQRVKMELPARGFSSYEKKWELPFILTEVSGIAMIDAQTIACIQDELGVIYIYHLGQAKITEEIPFAGAGDYEGVALAGKDAWVLRSDGVLYEITDYRNSSRKVTEHQLKFGVETPNLEGLCYDKKNNRLLIVPRELETTDETSKGVYSFDLSKKEFSAAPVFRIHMSHSLFSNTQVKRGKEPLMPSEIAVINDTIYITDARNAQVLLLDRKGVMLDLVPLNRNTFAKTEGIAFAGKEIYLSNEGKKDKPNILKINPARLNRE